MAAAMDSPMVYPDSPFEADDVAYPCKGCGQILEEGKAFELAGNRWHIDCFRCNTCNTLLDSDANLLLLGDGSLICNNCTYSCSNCGNKIEDLAILTGDQAFCANCFKCRNCKRKIENLRYARTSQGIFCMDCHEALMARRRKKTSRNTSSRSKAAAANNAAQLDKSLPAIPPPEARKTAYLPENTPLSVSDPLSTVPADAPSVTKTVSELQDSRPSTAEPTPTQSRDALALPSTTYRNNRHSMMSARSDFSAGGEEFLIPLAFDPNPSLLQSPALPVRSTPRIPEEKLQEYSGAKSSYFPGQTSTTKSATASPHIAFQEQGRIPSTDTVDGTKSRKDDAGSRAGSTVPSPFLPSESSRLAAFDSPAITQSNPGETLSSERFKLQEVPKTKRLNSSGYSAWSEAPTIRPEVTVESTEQPSGTKTPEAPKIDILPSTVFTTPRISREPSPAPLDSPTSPQSRNTLFHPHPRRGDSLESAKRQKTIPRKELNASATIPTALTEVLRAPSPSPSVEARSPGPPATDHAKVNGGKVISAPISSPENKSMFDTPTLSSQSMDATASGSTATASFVDPRAPPPIPPLASGHSRSKNQSISSTLHSETPKADHKSPTLPRYSGNVDFNIDEDMARIMSGEDQNQPESFLRRVSNSVRHGRSYSDKAGRMSKDRWPRSPVLSSIGQEISSPTSASPEHRDELSWFKNELMRERQRAHEREKKIAELEAQMESMANIKQVNSELKEKRSTMVVLDAQKEIVVRELEILTQYIAAAKESKEPLDVKRMSNVVLRDFAESLEQLKSSFAPQIEDYIQKRTELLEEITNLTTMKDKNFMEFEQLSSKNAQLADLNNQLVHQIQELYKANSGAGQELYKAQSAPAQDIFRSQMNGLGIYAQPRDKPSISYEKESRQMSVDSHGLESTTTLAAGEAEPLTMVQGPNVVNIRPKKFDWRKGQKVAKGVTKGLKGAFSTTQQNYSRELHFAETGAYGTIPNSADQLHAGPQKPGLEPPKQPGFGFFGNQKPPGKSNGIYQSNTNASTPSLLLDATTHLFGADLEQRAEFEKTTVPAIVRRCIDEVEERGMDVEGVYRKSGGNSQVQHIRDGFERAPTTFDISDPDLDIHAVTSSLKQYFRRLPTPLVTYEVYDRLLETTSITEPDAKIEAMQRALEGLPKVHYDTLDFLVQHLSRVVEQEKENLMTSMNIAVVFAPTIMRPESLGRELSDTKPKNEAVMFMVDECTRIFNK